MSNESQLVKLTKLPPVTPLPTPSPTLASGEVRLYKNSKFDDKESRKIRISGTNGTTDYSKSNVVFALGELVILDSEIKNKTSVIAFNLPIGTVMTLSDQGTGTGKMTPPLGNLSGLKRCVDLVGTGTTETVDLSKLSMKECLSAFFYRTVNLDKGAIELWASDDSSISIGISSIPSSIYEPFSGTRSTIFLSEWDDKTIYSFAGWYLDDRITSMRWKSLPDGQSAFFYKDGKGGKQFRISGSDSSKEVGDLTKAGFNICISSFMWSTGERALYMPPPRVETAYPKQLESGTVVLYDNNVNWSGNSLTLSMAETLPGVPYEFSGTTLQNKSKWIAFNLPEGVVMTLFEKTKTKFDSAEPYDFKDSGRCVDLIGTGAMQTVDLTKLGANGAQNCLIAYIWRRVNFRDGVFQLFEHDAFTGNRNTFFLGEWAMDKPHSLNNWWITNRTSSIYFGGVTSQSFTLYDSTNPDPGKRLGLAGWLSIFQVNTMSTSTGLNDKVSAWSWNILKPVYADPIRFDLPLQSHNATFAITQEATGTNTGDATIVETISVNAGTEKEMTLSVTDSSEIGYVETVTVGYSGGALTPGSSEELSCSFSQSYGHEESKTTTTSTSLAVAAEQTLNIPPNCTYRSTLTIFYTEIPKTSFSTAGTFYYDQKVPYSRLDDAISEAYKKPMYSLEQTVTGTIGGGIAVNTDSETTTTPLSAIEASGSGLRLTSPQESPAKSGSSHPGRRQLVSSELESNGTLPRSRAGVRIPLVLLLLLLVGILTAFATLIGTGRINKGTIQRVFGGRQMVSEIHVGEEGWRDQKTARTEQSVLRSAISE